MSLQGHRGSPSSSISQINLSHLRQHKKKKCRETQKHPSGLRGRRTTSLKIDWLEPLQRPVTQAIIKRTFSFIAVGYVKKKKKIIN